MLFIDETFMIDRAKGTLLAAIAKDGKWEQLYVIVIIYFYDVG